MIVSYKLIYEKRRYKILVKCDKCGCITEYEYNYDLAHPEQELDPTTKVKFISKVPIFKDLLQVCKMYKTANWCRNY